MLLSSLLLVRMELHPIILTAHGAGLRPTTTLKACNAGEVKVFYPFVYDAIVPSRCRIMSKAKKPVLAKLSDLRPGDYADCFVQLQARHADTPAITKPLLTCKIPRREANHQPRSRSGKIRRYLKQLRNGRLGSSSKCVRPTPSTKVRPATRHRTDSLAEERDRSDGFSELDSSNARGTNRKRCSRSSNARDQRSRRCSVAVRWCSTCSLRTRRH